MKKKIIIEIISALFILLFVYTALSKLYDPIRFKGALNKSPLIGAYSEELVWLVPVIELIVSAFIFMPKTKKIGLYSAVGLMTIFTLYIGYMVAFVPKLPCSCGGIIQKMSWNQHLIFNVGFILLGVYAIWLDRYNTYKILLYNKPADVATTAGEANVRLR